jgi:TatA/E family protein of Tat protein translocase
MLSIPHLIIIFVVALVVFGPEKLPELARSLGKVMAEFRRATGELRSTFEDHLRDLEREADLRRIGGGSPAPSPYPAEGTVAASHAQNPPTGAMSTGSADHSEPSLPAASSDPSALAKKPDSDTDPETKSDGANHSA